MTLLEMANLFKLLSQMYRIKKESITILPANNSCSGNFQMNAKVEALESTSMSAHG